MARRRRSVFRRRARRTFSRVRRSTRGTAGRFRRFMSGGGGAGGWGSKVVAAEWHAAAAMSPFTIGMAADAGNRSMLTGIAEGIQNKDLIGTLWVVSKFPEQVVAAAPQSLGLALGGGLIRALGRWLGF